MNLTTRTLLGRDLSVAAALLAFAALAALPACSSPSNSSPGDAGPLTIVPGTLDGGVVAAQLDSGSATLEPCRSCLFAQCTGLYSVCVSDPGCLAIFQCATAPSCAGDATGACVATCLSAQPEASQDLYAALDDCNLAGECNGGACASACSAEAPSCALGAPASDAAAPDASASADAASPPTASCSACQSAACASQLSACAASTDCAAYDTCALGCADTSECPAACAADHPSGAGAAAALATCTSASCPACTQSP